MTFEKASKLTHLRSLHIPTERDRAITHQLGRELLMEADASGNLVPVPVRHTAGLETRGIMIVEPPGGGKTTAVNWGLSKCEALNPPDAPPRYLHVPVPSPASLKSLRLQDPEQDGV